MPVVPALEELINVDLALSLPRYAQITKTPETLFFGINNPDDFIGDCDKVWLKRDRDTVERYLAEAQYEIEKEVRYPLHPQWFEAEEHYYANPVTADWRRVIEVGVRAEDDIALGEAVDHTNDPAVIGPTATTVTDEDEIRVYHPGTDVEIIPSSIEIVGGNVTIEIPRARMVTEAACDNPETGLDYTDTGATGPFEQTVDILRVYTSIATEGNLKWPHACSSGACCTCGDNQQTACLYVIDHEAGIITNIPATYSAGSWSGAVACCQGDPTVMEISYKAGLNPTTRQAEDAILRLAHSKMPHAPCGCEYAINLWTRDTNVPTVLTKERLNCPFGMSDGAWIAWRFTEAMRSIGMGVF